MMPLSMENKIIIIKDNIMLPAIKYKNRILEEFYLDRDDITIRRKKDGYHNRFKKHDIIIPFMYKGAKGYDYKGVHIPRTRSTISLPWLLTILRGITFDSNQTIDHKDGNTHNNSRSNIRIVSQEINTKNRKKRSDNTSGYTGLHYSNQAKRYIVRKSIKGKRLYKSSKTLDGALIYLKEFEKLALQDGYSSRHGK